MKEAVIALITEAAGDCIWDDGMPGYIDIDSEQTRQLFTAIRALPAAQVTVKPVAHAYVVNGECEQIDWGTDDMLDDPALVLLYPSSPVAPVTLAEAARVPEIAAVLALADKWLHKMDSDLPPPDGSITGLDVMEMRAALRAIAGEQP